MAHGRTAVFVFAAGMACLTLLSSVPVVRADGDESGLSPEFQDLYEWLEFNGMSGSGNAGLDPNPINGRGVVALADIAKGEKIVSIPKKVRLSAKVALNGKIGKPLKELMEAGVGSQELLTITLLFEKHRSVISFLLFFFSCCVCMHDRLSCTTDSGTARPMVWFHRLLPTPFLDFREYFA